GNIRREPVQRFADPLVIEKACPLGLALRMRRSGGANRHSQKNNANEGAFHRRFTKSCCVQLRAASVQRANTSASERTRGDCFAALRMRVTVASSAGTQCFSSQKSTLDFPLIGPISISCSRPKRCAGTPL